MTELVVKLKPRTLQGDHPAGRALPAGPARLGHGRRLRRPQARPAPRSSTCCRELEELTAETLGVIVYQDQVLQIANRLAGYSLGEADLLRRAMGKKKPEEMEKQRERFVVGLRSSASIDRSEGRGGLRADGGVRGLRLREVALDGLRADHLPDRVSEGEPPARVPGGAAHRSRSGNHDKLARYIAHAREHGDRGAAARRERVGARLHGRRRGHPLRLAGVKNVGEGAIEAILERARRGGRFASLFDFARARRRASA